MIRLVKISLVHKNEFNLSKLLLTIGLTVFLSFSLLAQSSSWYYKLARKNMKKGDYGYAIVSLKKAIEYNNQKVKYYKMLAYSYSEVNNIDSAISNYEKAYTLKGDFDDAYSAAKLCYDAKYYKRALFNSSVAYNLNRESVDNLHIIVNSSILLKKYNTALKFINRLIVYEKNYITLYEKAEILYALEDYMNAQSYFNLSIYNNNTFLKSWIGLSYAFYKQHKINQGITTASEAIIRFTDNLPAYIIRAKMYEETGKYKLAIDDYSSIIDKLDGKDSVFFFIRKRGLLHIEEDGYTLGIRDLSTVLGFDSLDIQARFNRGVCYKVTRNYSDAITDFELIKNYIPNDSIDSVCIKKGNQYLYELKRERNPPKVAFRNHLLDNDSLLVKSKGSVVTLNVIITDESKIKSFSINDTIYKVNIDSSGDFYCNYPLYLGRSDYLKIKAVDDYDNVVNNVYKLIIVESDAPNISLIKPYVSDGNQIMLIIDSNELFIEGKISDESLIESISINDITASFKPNNKNPYFSTTVDIRNISDLKFIVKDIHGNVCNKTIKLNRDLINSYNDNPMGITWFVFIENGLYDVFNSLEGPAKDARIIKDAAENYQIHCYIHKKDLTKMELDKFFAIQLRDILKENSVNSLVIWYAGHGVFKNNTGYWIPTDARTDDEFTYFNVNSLRSYLESYLYLSHILVVTDACESGPSFLSTSRNARSKTRCENKKLIKQKSSQVLSSAGYESASDNSMFTQTFASMLNYNPNRCISIDEIVRQINTLNSGKQKQKSQFGTIKGLNDENGTFFFLKKN